MHPQYTRQQFVRVCDCGCGQPTMISLINRTERGNVAGQPVRYLVGHAGRGKRKSGSQWWKMTIDGRMLRRVPSHPAAQNGYVPEHRLVVEAMLGRYLTSDEHVHHINGDRTDNRIENLTIVTPAEHGRLHYPEKRDRFKRSRNGRWAMEYDVCVLCGSTESPHIAHGHCYECKKAVKRGHRPPRQYKKHVSS